MRTPRTTFKNPLRNAQQVRALVRSQKEKENTKPTDRDAMAAGEKLLRGVAVRSNLRLIYRWKLKSFLRFAWVQNFPKTVSDKVLKDAVASARRARVVDRESIREALEKFKAIRGVHIPVASAFLTAMHPTKFTVMDRRAYRALGVSTFRTGIDEYLNYLDFCRGEAKRLGVSLRNLDQALWQLGSSRARRRHV
jgi:hypothetical protein